MTHIVTEQAYICFLRTHMFLCFQETVLLHAHISCQMAKRVQHYNRALIRHLIDDEAGAQDTRSDIEDFLLQQMKTKRSHHALKTN